MDSVNKDISSVEMMFNINIYTPNLNDPKTPKSELQKGKLILDFMW